MKQVTTHNDQTIRTLVQRLEGHVARVSREWAEAVRNSQECETASTFERYGRQRKEIEREIIEAAFELMKRPEGMRVGPLDEMLERVAFRNGRRPGFELRIRRSERGTVWRMVELEG